MGNVLLVHGGWVDSSCWDLVTLALRERGHQVEIVDLPLKTVTGDTGVAQDALDSLGTDVVVCGWSYGGVVITGLEPKSVRHLVYLAAFMPDKDESLNSLNERYPLDGVEALFKFDDAGNVSLASEDVDAFAWAGVSEEMANAARTSLRPQALQTFFDAPVGVSWREVPSTYVVCAEDRLVSPELQRELAQRATRVVEWDTCHAAMLSRPGLVTNLIDKLAR